MQKNFLHPQNVADLPSSRMSAEIFPHLVARKAIVGSINDADIASQKQSIVSLTKVSEKENVKPKPMRFLNAN